MFSLIFFFFFFNDTATTEIYTLSLHDALPISLVPTGGPRHPVEPGHPLVSGRAGLSGRSRGATPARPDTSGCAHVPLRLGAPTPVHASRSEEHTSELQSLAYLVCRLLLEKKKQ